MEPSTRQQAKNDKMEDIHKEGLQQNDDSERMNDGIGENNFLDQDQADNEAEEENESGRDDDYLSDGDSEQDNSGSNSDSNSDIDDSWESDSESGSYDQSDDEDDSIDEDRFSVKFYHNENQYIGKKYPHFQNIPDDIEILCISGCKNCYDPLCGRLLAFLKSSNRVWKIIELNGHPDDDLKVFSTLLLHSMTKSKNLHLFGMYEESFFDSLTEGCMLKDQTIQTIDINIRVPVTKHMISMISKGISQCKTLKEIVFCGDFSFPGNVTILAAGLKENKSIQSLKLIWVSMEQNGIEKILMSLENHPMIKTLNYQNPGTMSPPEGEALGAFLSSPSWKLERLEIWQNNSLPGVSNKFLKALSTSLLNRNLTLKELQMHRFGFDSASIPSLKHILSSFPNLKTLQLEENLLEPTDVSNLLLTRPFSHLSIENLELSIYTKELPKIIHMLCMNKGGRQLLHHPSQSASYIQGLWPLVLHRASKISYNPGQFLMEATHVRGASKEDFQRRMRANVIYHFLQEGAFIFQS